MEITSLQIAIKKNTVAIGIAMSDIESNIDLHVLYTSPFAAVGDVVNSVIAISIKLFHILYAALNISSVILSPFR